MYASADPDRMRQVFWNLADNARKAMPNGGTISVTVRAIDGRIEILFRDTGIGLTAQQAEKIFEPFQSDFERGTGLGLAIVYQAAEGFAEYGHDIVVAVFWLNAMMRGDARHRRPRRARTTSARSTSSPSSSTPSSDLIERDPRAFRGKFRKMAADPFAFYRGSAPLFYADVDRLEDPWVDEATARVWIQGDLHAENYGTYMDSAGVLVFDVNDFDEAYLGHYTWDLQRMAASLALLGFRKALSDASIRG